MGIRIAAVLLLTLGFVTGCGPQPVTKIVTIEFEPASPEQRLEAARILTARFDDYFGSLVTSVAGKSDGESLEFEFRGKPPDDALLRYIGSVQGTLRLYPANSPAQLLVSERDIEDLTASHHEDRALIDIQLTESAGQRLLAFTSRNVGRVLVMTLDRQEISRATVQGAFGRRFQTTGLDPALARTMKIVVKNGRLPVAVRNLDIKVPTASR